MSGAASTSGTNAHGKGSLRRLTSGEIALAKTVFRSTIEYHKVWIHHDSFLPFDLQDDGIGMAPLGELYFKGLYQADFSNAFPDLQNTFIHEMSHVWQRERGMCVIGRGLASRLVSYRYRLDGRLLHEYPMEQQAGIIADSFSLDHEGYEGWRNLIVSQAVKLDGDINEHVVRKQYRDVLRGFPWG